MTKKLRYDRKSWKVEDAIKDLVNRNLNLYYQDENYPLDEAIKFESEVNELLEKYKDEIIMVHNYSYENYNLIRFKIDVFDDKLEWREKALKKRKIRNGFTYGIGVLLAPTGIPAGIIGFKIIKQGY